METVALQSGVVIPAAVVQVAMKNLADRYAKEEQERTLGVKGTWKSSTIGAANGQVRDNRLRDYESYLNAVTIPWVYQAGSTIAGAYAGCKYHIVDEETGDPLKKGDAMAARIMTLLRRPNPWTSGRVFREKLMWHYELTGNAFVLKDNLDRMGLPTELHLLRPSRVRIQPSPTDYLTAFFYDMNGSITKYDPDRIVWFRRANPRDEYWGMGVIEPGETTFQTQRAIARTESSFFDSGARIKGVLSYDGTLTPEQEAALRDAWRSMDEGQSGQYVTAVMQAGMEYTPIQSDLLANGPGMETLANMSRDQILTLFGVPKQKVGIFEDANYRSIEADSFFQAETMSPIYQETNDDWTRIVQLFNPEWCFRHHEKVVTDYYDKAVTAHYMAQSASFTRNEIREVSGQEKMDPEDARGEQVVGPSTMTIFGAGGPVLPGGATGADPAPAGPEGQEGQEDQGTGDASAPMTPPPALAVPALSPGKKACGCPAQLAIAKKAGLVTALDLGICPRHVHVADRWLSEGQRRRYSAQQLLEGYPREGFPGLRRVIDAA